MKRQPLDFSYCPIDLGFDDNLAQSIENEIKSLPERCWFPTKKDHYGFYILPVKIQKKGYLPNIRQSCPVLIKFIQDKIVPLVGDANIHITRTLPNTVCNTHLGCHLKYVGERFFKLRAIIKGEIDELVLINQKGQPVKVKQGTGRSYLLDGGHPHWAPNKTNEERYIFAVGSPWRGCDENYTSLLDLSRSVKIYRPWIKKEWLHPEDPSRNNNIKFLLNKLKAKLRSL